MINSVVLTGRIAHEFELQTTADGMKLVNFKLAVDGNNPEEDTNFFPCIVFDKQAQSMCQYLAQGSLIGVEGRIKARKYETTKGEKRIYTEIIVRKLTFLETRTAKAKEAIENTPTPKSKAKDDNSIDWLDELI